MTIVQLAVGVFTLVTNYFFVAGEFALIAVRRSQIEPRAQSGDRRAKSVIWGIEHVSVILATAQVGITVSSLVLGAVAEPAIAHLLESPFHELGVPKNLVHPASFVLALGAATYVHMLFGEMVPKNIALAAPEQTAYRLVPPLVALSRAFGPVAFAINNIANRILRWLNVEPKDEVNSVFTGEELSRMVQDASDADMLKKGTTDLLRDALELGGRSVNAIVTPRAEVIFATPDTSVDELEALAVRTGFSRFPVIEADGTVSGYLHVKDVLQLHLQRHQPFPASERRPIAHVSQVARLDDVLAAMRHSRTHLAATIAPDGAVVGIITMEDILKQLVRPAT
jgi:CBS domain containing-hemolysin-like protein